jgi:hypothetical protein
VYVSENTVPAGTCGATALYQSGGSWTAVALGSTAMAGRVTVFNASYAPPSGFSDLTVRASANNGGAITVTVQQPVVRASALSTGFFATYFNGATRTGAYVNGACPAPADEPCTDSTQTALNEYRAYGVSGEGNTATCHAGTW